MSKIENNTKNGNNSSSGNDETTSTDQKQLGARLDNKDGKIVVAVNTTGEKAKLNSNNNFSSNSENIEQDKTENFVSKQKTVDIKNDPTQLGKEMEMGLKARVAIHIAAAETLAMFGVQYVPELPADLKSVAQEMPTKPNLTLEKLRESNIEPPEKNGFLPNLA